MERVIVTESDRFRELKENIEAEAAKKKAEQFSVIKGGVLKKDIGKVRFEFGTWSDGSGLNILRISW